MASDLPWSGFDVSHADTLIAARVGERAGGAAPEVAEGPSDGTDAEVA